MKTDFSLSNADLLLLFFCLFVHLVGFFLMHYGNSSIWAANITGYISFDWNKIILRKTDKQFLISYFYLQVNVNLVIVKRNENVLEVLFFILGQHLPNTDTINSHFQAAQLAFDSRHLVIAETYNKKFNWQTALSNRANRQHEAIQQRTLDFKKISVLKHGNIRRKSWVEIIGRWKCWKKKGRRKKQRNLFIKTQGQLTRDDFTAVESEMLEQQSSCLWEETGCSYFSAVENQTEEAEVLTYIREMWALASTWDMSPLKILWLKTLLWECTIWSSETNSAEQIQPLKTLSGL